MNNKERKSQIDELNEELKKINEKIKDSVDTVIISGMYMKDDIEEKRKKTAENLNYFLFLKYLSVHFLFLFD